MADAAMMIELVTPEASLLSCAAAAVMLRSSDGDLTILPGHTRIVTDVVPGLVRVEQPDGTVRRVAVHGGYLHVDSGAGAELEPAPGVGPGGPGTGLESGTVAELQGGVAGVVSTRVWLLAGIAERAEDIDVARAERARSDAEARAAELRARPLEGIAREAGEGGWREVPEGAAPGAAPGAAGDVELREAEAALARAQLRLTVAQGAS